MYGIGLMYSHTLYTYPLNCLHTYERSFWQAQSHTWIYIQPCKCTKKMRVYLGDKGIRLQAQSNTWMYNLQCYKNCTYKHSKSHVFVHWYTFDCSTHNRLFLGTLSKNSIHTLGLYRRYQEEYVLVRLQSGGSFVSANEITKTLLFQKEQFCL